MPCGTCKPSKTCDPLEDRGFSIVFEDVPCESDMWTVPGVLTCSLHCERASLASLWLVVHVLSVCPKTSAGRPPANSFRAVSLLAVSVQPCISAASVHQQCETCLQNKAVDSCRCRIGVNEFLRQTLWLEPCVCTSLCNNGCCKQQRPETAAAMPDGSPRC